MLFLHETHEVAGGRMEEFGAFMRDEWRPPVEADGSARLLWCWELTHGTGASYQAITVTGVRDWASWGAIAARMRADALHIAVATVARVDVLVSWNFKHIVNLRRIHAYNAVNLKRGYPLLEIRTPREVLDDE